MVRQPTVVAQCHVFFLPFFIQAFAAAFVQISLFQRNRSTAAQFAGRQATIFVVLFRRIEQVGPPSGFPTCKENRVIELIFLIVNTT